MLSLRSCAWGPASACPTLRDPRRQVRAGRARGVAPTREPSRGRLRLVLGVEEGAMGRGRARWVVPAQGGSRARLRLALGVGEGGMGAGKAERAGGNAERAGCVT